MKTKKQTYLEFVNMINPRQEGYIIMVNNINMYREFYSIKVDDHWFHGLQDEEDIIKCLGKGRGGGK
jgi:hypothetical protein